MPRRLGRCSCSASCVWSSESAIALAANATKGSFLKRPDGNGMKRPGVGNLAHGRAAVRMSSRRSRPHSILGLLAMTCWSDSITVKGGAIRRTGVWVVGTFRTGRRAPLEGPGALHLGEWAPDFDSADRTHSGQCPGRTARSRTAMWVSAPKLLWGRYVPTLRGLFSDGASHRSRHAQKRLLSGALASRHGSCRRVLHETHR